MQCAKCRQDNPPQAKFCLECGAPLARRCARCGTPLPLSARFCGECGEAGAAPEPASSRFASPGAFTPKHLAEKILISKGALQGERKQVTVLFADLKGSMELLAERDPEEARRILDPVLEQMMEAVHRYEGTVNQVMGDGIMALFGAPLAHEDHAVRACYAALRMQESIRRYTEETRHSHGVEVQIRVGLNSGEVVVRAIGNDLRMDYTAVGQTTHLAARMEQLATPGTIRLTAETLVLAEGYVQVKPLGLIPVKGLGDPIEAFELTGAGPLRTRLQRSAARGLTRFVGREGEVEELRRAAEQARAGRGQVVAVMGEPGVGKSRLFYEFVHSHRTHGWLILESGSVSYGKATAYLPVIDLLRAYFKIEDRDDTRAIRAKVTGNLLTLDEGLKESVPAVLWLLDALPADHEFQGLEAAQRRRRTLEALKRLLLRESRAQPLLLIFEDLHWIDSETQAFLDGLVESVPTAPILLGVNYRPEYQHGWGNKTFYRQLRIDPLPPESAQELLQTLLGDDPSVEPLKRLLIARTEGNPLFLEESVRALMEAQALSGERGAYRLRKAAGTIQVPPTVQAILAARIDRLAPDLKGLLQAASAIGKDVPFVLLQAVADLPESDLRSSLGQLQTGEFIYEARLFPDLEYTFKHALTHEVAYGSLLQDRRRALHAAIVGTMERLHADRLTEHVEVLAQHAERAELWEQAVRYLRQAGARAVARSAYREGIVLFERALKALERLPESEDTIRQAIEIRLALGPALTATRGPGARETEASYAIARDLCARVGDTSLLFPALWGLWYVHLGRGRYREARDLGAQLLRVAEERGDPALVLEAHHSLWPALFGMGEPASAREHLERGMALYDARQHRSYIALYGGHDPGVCSKIHAALALWTLGYPDQGLRSVQEGLQLAHQLSHPLSTVIAYCFTAWFHYLRGDLPSGMESAEAAVGLAKAQGFPVWGEYGNTLVRCFLLGEGRDAEALAEVHRKLQAVKRELWGWREVYALCLLAEGHAKAGQPERGLELLSEVMAEPHFEGFYEPQLYRLKGELLGQAPGDPREAEACFRRAIGVARSRQARSLELRAAAGLARLLTRTGRRDEAVQTLGPVYGWFTEGFETADLRAAKALLDEVSAAGRP
jgi:class 3 adenylate cyclase/predicted ATPase